MMLHHTSEMMFAYMGTYCVSQNIIIMNRDLGIINDYTFHNPRLI